ncbi:MAG TPA: 1-(5-phosphoribosyl)-5-[(5-phosphoribosylamino)methylideneamino] imidazole-4-carboxamide isomerase [Candidatus Acidoferrales bacterium]|nr:1-(5-phosphoribosyl)-5-[(5-phosphoribosylamino)methylideneamino] imidazole-4-carboxamide isomerase [Candidatus Acidoferrales bacterium]
MSEHRASGPPHTAPRLTLRNAVQMAVVPAIDLLQGRPVRLVQGRYDRVLGYGQRSVELAETYAREGAERLHLVDLDGARIGSWQNLQLIGQVVRSAGVPVQAGGGARDDAQVRAALQLGVDRVVISTAAMGDRDRLVKLVKEFGSQLAVSLDARADQVVTEGWAVGTGMGLIEAAQRMADTGVTRLIYTDVLRDGTLAGPGLTMLSQLVGLGLPVMVAGGVSTYQDLTQLRAGGAEAAIVGRALLDGVLSLPAALAAAGGRAPASAGA